MIIGNRAAAWPLQDYTEARVGVHGAFFTGSDRYPGTIIGVKEERGLTSIAVQFDSYRRIPNAASGQRFLVWRNLAGTVVRFTWSLKYDCFVREDEGLFVLGLWEAKIDQEGGKR